MFAEDVVEFPIALGTLAHGDVFRIHAYGFEGDPIFVAIVSHSLS